MESIEKILDKYHYDNSQLIAVLHDIQTIYNYLPKEVLEAISEKLKVPLSDIYQVATFYKAFSMKPRGKYHIKVCLGTACHVRGSQKVLESVKREIGIKSNETSKDGLFSLETVNCLGCCALGPVLVVNNDYHGNMNSSKVKKVLKAYR